VKNLSLIVNFILIIAVGFLFYKVYSNDKSPAPTVKSGNGLPSDAIVFVNSDSLLKHYDYFNNLKENLEKKEDSIDNLLKSRAHSLENEIEAYQQKAPGLSPEQRAGIEEKLLAKQQQIMEMKQNLVDKLNKEESQMMDSLHAHLTEYLKSYNKDRNYYYILGYQRGSGILLANDSLDITDEIIEGINK
jgi:outer membrane protein